MLMAETWMEAFFKRVLTVMIDFKLYFIFFSIEPQYLYRPDKCG